MKIKTYIRIATALAVASSALFSNNTNAQPNSAWGKMMWSNYGPDSIKASWAMTNPMDGSLTAPDGHYLIPPQRIQLSAKISGEVVTNWTTSITSPVVPESERNFAVYRPDILNQSGVIKSNTLATIQWHGKPVTVILETVQIGTTTRTTWKDAPQ
jgi:hypothetical protein